MLPRVCVCVCKGRCFSKPSLFLWSKAIISCSQEVPLGELLLAHFRPHGSSQSSGWKGTQFKSRSWVWELSWAMDFLSLLSAALSFVWISEFETLVESLCLNVFWVNSSVRECVYTQVQKATHFERWCNKVYERFWTVCVLRLTLTSCSTWKDC